MLLAPFVHKKRPQQSLVDHIRHLWALPYFLEQDSFFDGLDRWHTSKLGQVDFEVKKEKPTLQFIQNQTNEPLHNPIEGYRLHPVHCTFCVQRPYRIQLIHCQWLLT